MSSRNEEDDRNNLRIDLGLTVERANELSRIIQAMLDQESSNASRSGRTSHVLLNIAGRRDLTDVEKAVCVFIFSTKVNFSDYSVPMFDETVMPDMHIVDIGRMPKVTSGMKEREFIDIERGITGMIVSPEGIDKYDMINVVMSTLVAVLGDVPKYKAMDICREMSISFARMALTGNIKL